MTAATATTTTTTRPQHETLNETHLQAAGPTPLATPLECHSIRQSLVLRQHFEICTAAKKFTDNSNKSLANSSDASSGSGSSSSSSSSSN
ncbi:hypothetical protein ACLKA7_004259 [Drosophila subpalustris]